MKTHPIHVVTAWMENTPSVAMRHYLQVTVQNPGQSADARKCREETLTTEVISGRKVGLCIHRKSFADKDLGWALLDSNQ